MTARPQVAQALHAAWAYGRTSWEAVRAGQDAALRRLAVHAYEQVPYYHRLFERHRLHPRHLRGVVDLELVPLTGRDDLRAQRSADLLARGTDPAALLASADPSDGPPRHHTRLEDLLRLLHRTRALASLGVETGDRIAVVGGAREDDWKRHGVALQLLGLRRRRYFQENGDADATARAVAAYLPDVLVGPPAALHRLASAPSARALAPRLVVVEGRPPMPRLRARLGEAFGAPVRATYGLGADTPLAAECRETGAFHVADGWTLLEILVDGRPAVPGERGEVVVTLLHSYAMPILRHQLGHLATRGGRCACGAPFSTILTPDV